MDKLKTLELMIKMRELGITEDDVTLMHDKLIPKMSSNVPELSTEDIVKPLSVLDEYSEDEILYYSTPYFDELQAKKERKEEL